MLNKSNILLPLVLWCKIKSMNQLQKDQRGLIPLLVFILVVVIGIIVFAFLRVKNGS